jgi:hypothetical protein
MLKTGIPVCIVGLLVVQGDLQIETGITAAFADAIGGTCDPGTV